MFKLFALLAALVSASPMQFCPDGLCPEIVALGQHCGGFLRTAPVCGPGLYCKLSKVADAGGVCLNNADSDGVPFGGYCVNESDCTSGTFCKEHVCERLMIA
ncbi:hypothetical protein HDV06_005491 [Boothiomyces sp. JEL0866]|nr:hypothetical protein HDV06_005491 [Boothiomyces sp. JEL0866]